MSYQHRYTLLVGKPPFETSSLKDTYSRIKRNEYRIPSTISLDARNLIQKLLQADPKHRPATENILCDPFFQIGFTPAKLPIRYVLSDRQLFVLILLFSFLSCLTVAPHFKRASSIGVTDSALAHRKPLGDANQVAIGEGFRKPFSEANHGAAADLHKPFPSDNPGPAFQNESEYLTVFLHDLWFVSHF